MQQIIIRPEVLDIHFVHEQEMGKNKSIQIPASKLEQIITEWVDKQPVAASSHPYTAPMKEDEEDLDYSPNEDF